MSLPAILSNAPAWAADLFWIVVGVGAAVSVLHRFFIGAKVEGAKIERTGKPTPTHTIAGDSPPPLGMGTLSVLGGGIVERQVALDHIEVGRQMVDRMEDIRDQLAGFGKAVDRLAIVFEKHVASVEREEHRAEVMEEARRLAKQMRDEEIRAGR